MNIFKERLKILIKQSQKMQITICKDLNIPKQKLSNWKSGYTEPNLTDLTMLSKYFNVSTDYLLGLEDESGRKTYINNYGKINNISNNNFNNSGDINF